MSLPESYKAPFFQEFIPLITQDAPEEVGKKPLVLTMNASFMKNWTLLNRIKDAYFAQLPYIEWATHVGTTKTIRLTDGEELEVELVRNPAFRPLLQKSWEVLRTTRMQSYGTAGVVVLLACAYLYCPVPEEMTTESILSYAQECSKTLLKKLPIAYFMGG